MKSLLIRFTCQLVQGWCAYLVVLFVGIMSKNAEGAFVRPVPPDDALVKADTTIRELFKEDLKASTTVEKTALANKLIEQSSKVTDDPAAEFQLLKLASKIAAEAGMVEVTNRALEILTTRYCVSGLDLKFAALEDGAMAARTPEANLVLANAYLRLAQDAVAKDQFELAQRAVDQATRQAQLGRDQRLQADSRALGKSVRDKERSFQAIGEAREKLLLAPDDSEANATIGEYYLSVGQVERALIHLSRGADQSWKELAAADLKEPEQPKEQLELGERWYALVQTLKDKEQEVAKSRAALWYRRALPGIAGLAKLRIEKRLQELAVASVSAPDQPGVEDQQPDPAGKATERDGRITADEFKKLRELSDGARLGDTAKRDEFFKLRREYHQGLAANPENWTDAEMRGRVDDEIELNKLYNKAMGINYFFRRDVMNSWPSYVATASSPQQFLARLKDGPAILRRYLIRDVIETTNETLRGAIDRYIDKNPKVFPDKAKKFQFGEWLRQSGIDKQMIKSWQDGL